MSQPDDVIVKVSIKSTRLKVWSALTDLSEMKEWYFDNIPAFEAVVGFSTDFEVQSDNRVFHHMWKVTNVVPQERLAYSWRYKDIEGESESDFEITETSDGVSIRLRCIGLDSFPGDIPEFHPESCHAGWTYFLGRLKDFLERD